MEPPVNMEAKSIPREKVKVLEALRPVTPSHVAEKTVRGQYNSGLLNDASVPGYLEEGANTQNTTKSFVAVRVDIDNWRWADVLFYLRTGKRMQIKELKLSSILNNYRIIYLKIAFKTYQQTS